MKCYELGMPKCWGCNGIGIACSIEFYIDKMEFIINYKRDFKEFLLYKCRNGFMDDPVYLGKVIELKYPQYIKSFNTIMLLK